MKKTIVITGGDPRGIGPEVILKSLNELYPVKRRGATFVVIGDYRVFRKRAAESGIVIPPVEFIDLKNAPLQDIKENDKLCGSASMEYLRRGISVVKRIKNSALVTAPIMKRAIQKAGFKFAGHTEFLAHVTRSKTVTMMLVSGPMRISVVTRHLPLRSVCKEITRQRVIDTVKNTYYALKLLFRIKHPRVGVAGLNPHAGEGGILGTEERYVISPAVKVLKRNFKYIEGPLPPDTLFYKVRTGLFHAVVAMYHDQGLGPFKMVSFETGVNLTLGLPFIRTSPDHGTAFDIATRGSASHLSMKAAIELAINLSGRFAC